MLRPFALAALTACGALAIMVLGCQTYDFEPVTPLTLAQTTQIVSRVAKKLKPNVMLLVDKSGSMLAPINAADPRCPASCGTTSAPCPANCPTRIGDMRNAMAAFLASAGTIARFGLTFFPTDNQCGFPSTSPDVPLPAATANDEGADAALASNAAKISTKIGQVVPLGGTPTAASLSFMGTIGALTDTGDERDDVVLLLTDGLPNCNLSNPNQMCRCDATACGSCTPSLVCPAQKTTCRCTLPNCDTNPVCTIGCLDQDNAVGQIEQLSAKGIKTLVIGFGADTGSGDAALVLQAMGEAGDLAPKCRNGTDDECGIGNRCDVSKRTCERKFYQASNQAELQRVLAEFSASLVADPCVFLLDDTPSDPRFIAVLVEGNNVAPGADTWSYVNGTITFAPASTYCASMKASTVSAPVNVEIRFIQQL